MLNLAEYRKSTASLTDYLPWACLVAPGIVLNKDGSFQRTIRYRGPDLESATEAELVSVAARLNNVLRRFGSGWALFFEAERIPANTYPGARFADPVSWLVDQERRAAFSADGAHHESRYYLTILFLPPPEGERRFESFFYERDSSQTIETDAFAAIEMFQTETDRAFELLSAILPEAKKGKTVLIAAHGNSLRAIVMELEKLTPDQIMQVNIETCRPILYDVNASGVLTGKKGSPVPA